MSSEYYGFVKTILTVNLSGNDVGHWDADALIDFCNVKHTYATIIEIIEKSCKKSPDLPTIKAESVTFHIDKQKYPFTEEFFNDKNLIKKVIYGRANTKLSIRAIVSLFLYLFE